MPVLYAYVKSITVALRLLCLACAFHADCKPISNGFSLKFNPLSVKEQVKPKSFGNLFAKVPQELPDYVSPGDILSEAIFAHQSVLANGCTNQVAKMLYPSKGAIEETDDETQQGETVNFINIPVMDQPAEKYNILVATAPKNIKLGKESESLPTVLYVVFPDSGKLNESNMNLPAIYFVNGDEKKVEEVRKEKVEPIFIIDSNRTVTGLKSKAVSKFVRFKNKLTNLYDSYHARD